MADEARKIRTVNETESSFETTGSSGLRCVASDTGNWLYVSQDGTKLYKSARQSYKTSGVTTYLDNDFNDVTVRGDCLVAEYIKMFNDTNNSIRFRNDQINIYAGGVDVVDIQDDAVIINEDLTLNGTFICDTINTGQGDVECYAMNQDVETTDAVTFSTINTGHGDVECYAMNQDVETSDNVQFSNINITANTTGTILSQLYNSNNTTTSAHALHAIATGGSSAGNPLQRFLVSGDVNGWVTGIDAADSNKLKWTNPYNDFTFAQAKMTLTIGGRLGIGTPSPTYKLDVNGDFRSNTVNTGHGDVECYAMNQDVETDDNVAFEKVSIGTSTHTSVLSVNGDINQKEKEFQFLDTYFWASASGTKTKVYDLGEATKVPFRVKIEGLARNSTSDPNNDFDSCEHIFTNMLESNSFYGTTKSHTIYEDNTNHVFTISAVGSSNRINVTLTNNDIWETYTGILKITILAYGTDSVTEIS